MVIIKKSSGYISNLGKFITNNDFINTFDFMNQHYSLDFDHDPKNADEKYVKVKYLKGKR